MSLWDGYGLSDWPGKSAPDISPWVNPRSVGWARAGERIEAVNTDRQSKARGRSGAAWEVAGSSQLDLDKYIDPEAWDAFMQHLGPVLTQEQQLAAAAAPYLQRKEAKIVVKFPGWMEVAWPGPHFGLRRCHGVHLSVGTDGLVSTRKYDRPHGAMVYEQEYARAWERGVWSYVQGASSWPRDAKTRYENGCRIRVRTDLYRLPSAPPQA